jgi:hypothetical protein
MAEPWFDPMASARFAGLIGGGAGALLGLLGALTGTLLPRGKGQAGLTVVWGFFVVVGLASLAAGIIALTSGQPYAIWYPLTLCGVIVGGLSLMALSMVRKAFRMLQARKLAAAEIRGGNSRMA